MATQETLRNVPADRVEALLARYHAIGATAQSFAQGDGLFTIVATFPGSLHSTPFATLDAAETGAVPAEGAPAAAHPVVTSTDFADLADEYRRLFDTCTVDAAQAARVRAHVEHLQANAPRYRAIGDALQIPWAFIGIVHSLESGFDFGSHLHNGDPLSARTTHEPAGRPTVGEPPFSWEDSARDALSLKGFAGQADWSLARQLFRWEAFNGFGYRRQGLPSPYLWSFSGHYRRGLFVRDHVFDADAVSKQPGAAVLLKAHQASML